jgi:DNA-binding Lrp family transcriptional regulator
VGYGGDNEIDQRIVALLRTRARRSFQSIGGDVGLSAPAVKRRVDRLEQRGVIRSYAAVVDPGALGWPTRTFVFVFCEGRMTADEVRASVAPHPEVTAAYTVAGEASAVLEVQTRDTAHLEETLERIRDAPGIVRTQTQLVLSTLFERPVA